MKLVGEYELTDNGVVIEGKINDSHIYEIRNLLKPLKEAMIYHGEAPKGSSESCPVRRYTVPHPVYRKYIRRVAPGIITPENERKFVNIQKSFQDDDHAVYYHDGSTFHNNLGILYGDGEGRTIMDERQVLSYMSMTRNKTRLLTNSAWVWNTQRDGSFKVELNGLVNRHMMAVVLGNATKLARYIDTVLVKVLDHASKFNAIEVGDYLSLTARRF